MSVVSMSQREDDRFLMEAQIAGAVINAAAVNLGMYIAGRAVMGVGISMALTIAPTLLQEFAHPRYRAPIGSMCKSQECPFYDND